MLKRPCFCNLSGTIVGSVTIIKYIVYIMKPLQKITSVFLIAAVLLFSIGLSTNKMVCLKSGKTKVSINHVEDCCKENKSATTTIKSNCCDITNAFLGLDDFSVTEINTIQSPDVSNALVVQNYFDVTDYKNTISPLFSGGSSPPLYGRTLLTFISTFII